ncbi:MAG: hypothetical protein U5L76_00175 [Patescibacteria group bacterium]|nr:hypothetical protein [Patescibacteria group bacterium]
MPKIIREKPVFFLVPAFILILGAVFLFTHVSRSASEFEKEAGPPGYDDINIMDIAAHFNPHTSRYYAWTVGYKHSPYIEAQIFTYNGATYSWQAQNLKPCGKLKAVDLFYDTDYNHQDDSQGRNGYRAWAVGEYGYILKYTDWERGDPNDDSDNYEGWGYLCDTSKNDCNSDGTIGEGFDGSQNISELVGSNLTDVDFINKDTGWIVASDGKIFKTTNGGLEWEEKADYDWNINAISMLPDGSAGLVVGYDYINNRGYYALYDGNNWTPDDIGSDILTDVEFVDSNHAWIAINANQYYYYHNLSFSPLNTGLGLTSPPIMNSVTATLDGDGQYNVWFAGEDGKIIFSKDNTNWYFQTTEVPTTLHSIDAVNPTHVWSVGNDSLIMKISPGNAAGWGWVGADNCESDDTCDTPNPADTSRQYPAQWISFNCANQQVCDETTFSYGVNIKTKVDDWGDCTDTRQDKDVGALSGYAWFGKYDPYERLEDVKCDYEPGDGNTYCSNNHLVICNGDITRCDCGNNKQSCYSSGWLSFDRDDTGDPPAEPYQNLPVTTPFNDDTACTNKIIDDGDPEDYVLATFDYETYGLDGWARFKLGQCSNDISQSCFKDSECGSGNTCDYNGQGRCQDDWSILCINNSDCPASDCQYPQGWVKFRGVDKTGEANNYTPCQACLTHDPNNDDEDLSDDDGDEYMTCKICEGVKDSDTSYMCNQCGQSVDKGPCDTGTWFCEGDGSITCTTDADCITYPMQCGNGLCSGDTSKACLVDSNYNHCGSDGVCVGNGYCSEGNDVGQPCLYNSDCEGTSTCENVVKGTCSNDDTKKCIIDGGCENGGVCENYLPSLQNFCFECNSCNLYGVSVDIDAGDWYGHAYSEDFGWIDMSKVGQYNTAWVRAEYGDIYSSGNVGTPQTARAPGWTTADRDCNATYLILAGGSVTNFCSEADFNKKYSISNPGNPSDANPYVVEGYRAFNKPEETSPHSLLGTIKVDKLIEKKDVELQRNGIEDPLSRVSSNQLFDETNSGDLGGKIYYVNDNLWFYDLPYWQTYLYNGESNSSGLIIVEGDLFIDSDIYYDDSDVDKINKLPSVGFYVKGNIHIGKEVENIVGAYYTEGNVYVSSTGSANTDKKLTVKGLMIASGYSFKRRFKGTMNNPQPAEVISYDGRIQLNPPPGFRDLVQSLPKMRPATP